MATPEAQAEGQNPAYKPTHRHHQPDQGKRLEHLALGYAEAQEAPPATHSGVPSRPADPKVNHVGLSPPVFFLPPSKDDP